MPGAQKVCDCCSRRALSQPRGRPQAALCVDPVSGLAQLLAARLGLQPSFRSLQFVNGGISGSAGRGQGGVHLTQWWLLGTSVWCVTFQVLVILQDRNPRGCPSLLLPYLEPSSFSPLHCFQSQSQEERMAGGGGGFLNSLWSSCSILPHFHCHFHTVLGNSNENRCLS